MAMQVAGTMMLGDLIKWALAHGARLEQGDKLAMSDDFDEWYRPEYLVRGRRHVPLPTTNDRQLMLDAPKVNHIKQRLGFPISVE